MTAPADLPTASAARPSRRRRWLIAAGTIWAVLVLVLGYASVQTDPPTVAEQRSLVQAQPVLDRASGELLAAVGDAGAVEIGALQVRQGCRLTPARDGAQAHRDLLVYVAPQTGPAVLDQVAAALPPTYGAVVRHTDEHVLRADAGDFVALRGVLEDGGQRVRLRAFTGCRPAEEGVPGPDPTTATDHLELTRVLAALRLPSAAATVRQVPCPGGGPARTTATSARWAGDDLGAALLAVTATANVVRADATTVAYRMGAASVVVAVADGVAHAAVTVAC